MRRTWLDMACGRDAEAAGDSSASAPAKRARKDGDASGAERMQEVHDVQLELQLLDERCAEEQLGIQHRYDQLRRPHFDKRAALLRRVPKFWQAAFLGHPGHLVHPAEIDALAHLQDLDVRDNLDHNGSYEVSATFAENEFFKERAVTKKVTFQDALAKAVHAGVLTAAGEKGRAVLEGVGGRAARSVLGWLTSREEAGGGPGSPEEDLGELLRRDLWQDPVPYYLAHRGGTGPGEAAGASSADGQR
mmetsp:Transcript_92981/g.263140  ORF Transcript_92981/g.263140 Transcript_92981/m.263140 type:complete len:247 (-) Transcript_92981:114-854(-)